MKLNFNTHSIKFKVCLYFIIFAVLLLVILWSLQVLFLNTFYQTMKEAKTEKVAKSIELAYERNDLAEFSRQVAEIAESSDMYIYISYAEGLPFMLYGLDNSNHDYTDEILRVKQEMEEKNLKSVSLMIDDPSRPRRILACGNILRSEDKPELMAGNINAGNSHDSADLCYLYFVGAGPVSGDLSVHQDHNADSRHYEIGRKAGGRGIRYRFQGWALLGTEQLGRYADKSIH